MSEILFGNLRIEMSSDAGNGVRRVGPTPVEVFTSRFPDQIRPSPELLGRDRELSIVRDAIRTSRPLEFNAPCGFGVTTLLRFVSAAAPGTGISASYIYLRVGDQSLADIVHAITSAAYTCLRPTRPTMDQSVRLLGQLRAVVVLDDVRVGPSVVSELVRLLPHCCLLVGAPRQRFQGYGRSEVLPGLDLGAALELLDRDLGRPLTEAEGPPARRLWAALSGQPGRLRQAAALVVSGRMTVAQLADATENDPSAMDQLSVDALSTAHRKVLGFLAFMAGLSLPSDVLGALADVTDIQEALGDLLGQGLAEQDGEEFATSVCTAAKARHELMDYVDLGEATRVLIDRLNGMDPSDPGALSMAGAALTLVKFWAEEREWSTVVELVRVAEPVLTLAGRWVAAADALSRGIEAARSAHDLAAQAFFLHQQGTLELCEDRLTAAQESLSRSLELREELHDQSGITRTRRNLDQLYGVQPPPPPPPPSPPPLPWWRQGWVSGAAAGAAVALLLLIVTTLIGLGPSSGDEDDIGTAGATSDPSDPSDPSTPSTPTPTSPTPTTAPPSTSPPTSQPVAAVSPAALVFLDADVTPQSGQSLRVTMRNSGRAKLVIGEVSRSGPQKQDFEPDGGCAGRTLAPKETCRIGVTFRPQALGERTASLEISHNAVSSVTVVPLSGRGAELPDLVPVVDKVGTDLLRFVIKNQGKAAAGPTTATVSFDGVTGDPIAVKGLDVDESSSPPVFEATVPQSCWTTGCDFVITADSGRAVHEITGDNNRLSGRTTPSDPPPVR